MCNQIAIAYAIDALNGGVPFGQLDIMKRPNIMNELVMEAMSYINQPRSNNGNN